ncbi:MAG: hypothetical protein FJX51_12585 [Alphaproteobacteria bacterium]|nr:hypothetical protein [Alphaproteobacteria bacterium]
MNRHDTEMLMRVRRLGIAEHDVLALRRVAKTLHRWHERECGDGSHVLERHDGEVPYEVYYGGRGEPTQRRVPDLEKGALKRLAAIMARYPTLTAYIQTDPRGAPLYLLRPEDIIGDVSDCYTRGTAVY